LKAGKQIRTRAAGIEAALLMGALIFFGLAAPRTSGQSATQWSVDAVLKQLDAASKEFHSLTADLERTKVTVVVNDKSTETGQIMVRRDDKMRIELVQPNPRTILRDGDQLSIYNPMAKQVEEFNLGKHRALVDQFLLLGFGTSGKELNKSFLVTVQGEETLDKKKVLLLELTPKSDDVRNQVSKIHLWVDQATWMPIQQKFFETGSGDYLIVHYTNIVRNVRLADSHFKAHWPHGTTKVKGPQG
jgi:outer membrane lipoprotein-sorting protein